MSLILDDLGHRFGQGPWLFRHLDHTFAHGLTAVVGPSGTGKSTLLNLLTGALKPAEGCVRWDGPRHFAFVHQTAHGVAGRSVRDHIALPLVARGATRLDADARAERVAGRFGLEPLIDAPYRQLSGGEAQRLMLAIALAQGAPTILADEPTANLDSGNAASVISALAALADDGAAVVIATHDHRVREVVGATLDLSVGTRP